MLHLSINEIGRRRAHLLFDAQTRPTAALAYIGNIIDQDTDVVDPSL